MLPLSARLRASARQLGFAYRQLWSVMRLPAVWKLTAFLVTYRIGIQAAEGAYQLKLIDKVCMRVCGGVGAAVRGEGAYQLKLIHKLMLWWASRWHGGMAPCMVGA